MLLSHKRYYHTHFVFAITGEDADPLVIIVSDDDVTIGMNSDTSGPLQLPWRSPANSKPALKLALIGEDLSKQKGYNYKFRDIKAIESNYLLHFNISRLEHIS